MIQTEEEALEGLQGLFVKRFGHLPPQVTPLPASGSDRRYYRLGEGVIGAWHQDENENDAFLRLAMHFHAQGIAVPEVLAHSSRDGVYLQQDLGDLSLLACVQQQGHTARVKALYRLTLDALIRMQTTGMAGLKSVAHPQPPFDRQAMMWDLNYFKYCFLKTEGAPFADASLETDFAHLCDALASADLAHFMHRDFQARNVMVSQERPFVIDFQGGRPGPLAYDVASLLYQAKAQLPSDWREELLTYYIQQQPLITDEKGFRSHYHSLVLLRVLQTLGAYGFRGRFERRQHFIDSIPAALANAVALLQSGNTPAMPAVLKALLWIRDKQNQTPAQEAVALTVTVNSFSYKSGIPADASGHGGGFVFDCRFIDNPGRQAAYKNLTGLDEPVRNYLNSLPAFGHFLDHVFAIVDDAVSHYLARNFDHLSVQFGCTGGQHRSVASAEALAAHLKTKFGVKVNVNHTQSERWPRPTDS